MFKPLLSVLALLSLASCQSTATTAVAETALLGPWHVERIQNKPVIDYSPAQLVFGDAGQLSGNNSCNTFAGHYVQTGNSLALTPENNTLRACIDSLMAQEQQLMQLLPQIRKAGLTSTGKLQLSDNQGKTLLLLSRLQEQP